MNYSKTSFLIEKPAMQLASAGIFNLKTFLQKSKTSCPLKRPKNQNSQIKKKGGALLPLAEGIQHEISISPKYKNSNIQSTLGAHHY
jgi:hypothetical protein